jgi:uncharacterized membrane protein YhaH (DUF805 family)
MRFSGAVALETPTLLQDDPDPPEYVGPDGKAGAQRDLPGKPSSNDVSSEANETKLFAAQTSHRKPPLATEAGLRSEFDDGDGTVLFDQATRAGAARTSYATTTPQDSALTRVGAIMGTPLYMSPEQCAGEHLDARSDIYSLGVIAYQMLAGEPPFAGVTSTVMRAHREIPPPPLRERNPKVRKRAAQIVMSALSKNPGARPQTASAFASSLSAQAEGIGSLYRRAFALYSEYFPKFLKMSLIAHVPVIVLTIFIVVLDLTEKRLRDSSRIANIAVLIVIALTALLQIAAYFLAASSISGMTAIIVTQLSVAPLRPVHLSTALAVLKKRWRPFLNTSIRMTCRIMLGFLLIIPGIVISIRYALYAPVVLLEGLSKKAARVRSRQLAARSWRTMIIVALLQFLIPMVLSALLGRFSMTTKATSSGMRITHSIWQNVSGLVNIFVIPLISIVPALLYLRMRQLGGEPLSDLLAQIEDVDAGRSKWQQRMRTRVSFSSSNSQKTTGPKN